MLNVNHVKAQKLIHTKINSGLGTLVNLSFNSWLIILYISETILLEAQGLPKNHQPTMKYRAYESFVVNWGVQLIGWPGGMGVRPIDEIQTGLELHQLLTALNDDVC